MNMYPYTNFHDLNLDWIVSKLIKLKDFDQDLTGWYPSGIINLLSYLENSDFYSAITNAINDCPIHGTIYIPLGNYSEVSSRTITINKPLSIIGGSFGYDLDEPNFHSPLITSNGDPVFLIASPDVRIENLSIVSTSVGNSIINITAGNSSVQVPRNVVMRNIYIDCVGGRTSYGIYTDQLITSIFENVRVTAPNIPFRIGSVGKTSTTITMINCQAGNPGNIGFSINETMYSSFINCAVDSAGYAAIGYALEGCRGTSLINCGAETCTDYAVKLFACESVSVSGVSVNCGGSTGYQVDLGGSFNCIRDYYAFENNSTIKCGTRAVIENVHADYYDNGTVTPITTGIIDVQ